MDTRSQRYVRLDPFYDTEKLCANPHKGWYLHYFDNSLKRYGTRLEPDDFLTDFPGFNHIYLRLAWSYLEPQEGVFDWALIDRVIDPWVAAGRTVAFRITCVETDPDQGFATSQWVMDAGARGSFIRMPDGHELWEPDFGDPVFLEKLERFHRAFAARYADKPWLEYVDIGSYGEWGEGHTEWTSAWERPFAVIRAHVDLHLRCYPHTFLIINDDFVTGRPIDDPDCDALLDYFLEKRLAIRDDSISYIGYMKYGESTLRSPAMFELLHGYGPVDLELEHYRKTTENNTWHGGAHLAAAMREAHGTFLGFHGFAREWLAENAAVARQLANECGYWYFIKGVEASPVAHPGATLPLTILWENRGVAPAYHRYDLTIRLTGTDETGRFFDIPVPESDNRTWLPQKVACERLPIRLPDMLPCGTYSLGIRLEEKGAASSKPITLGMCDDRIDREGFFHACLLAISTQAELTQTK